MAEAAVRHIANVADTDEKGGKFASVPNLSGTRGCMSSCVCACIIAKSNSIQFDKSFNGSG